MKNEQIQEFFTKVEQDEGFKAEVLKFKEEMEAKKLNEQDVQKFVGKVLLPKAKKLGYDFSEKDLADFGNLQGMASLTELSPEDLENVSGGVNKGLLGAMFSLAMFMGVGAGVGMSASATDPPQGKPGAENVVYAVGDEPSRKRTRVDWDNWKNEKNAWSALYETLKNCIYQHMNELHLSDDQVGDLALYILFDIAKAKLPEVGLFEVCWDDIDVLQKVSALSKDVWEAARLDNFLDTRGKSGVAKWIWNMAADQCAEQLPDDLNLGDAWYEVTINAIDKYSLRRDRKSEECDATYSYVTAVEEALTDYKVTHGISDEDTSESEDEILSKSGYEMIPDSEDD